MSVEIFVNFGANLCNLLRSLLFFFISVDSPDDDDDNDRTVFSNKALFCVVVV